MFGPCSHGNTKPVVTGARRCHGAMRSNHSGSGDAPCRLREDVVSEDIIRTEGLTKHYVLGAETVKAVRSVDLVIKKG